jgi:hypothetical protein
VCLGKNFTPARRAREINSDETGRIDEKSFQFFFRFTAIFLAFSTPFLPAPLIFPPASLASSSVFSATSLAFFLALLKVDISTIRKVVGFA